MSNLAFEEAKEKNMERLEQFTPIVLRVHGDNHPEMNEVNDLFNQLREKIKTADKHPDLEAEFHKLRDVTQNYEIPNDVCESYEAVYNMLEELDLAYHE